MLEFRIGSEAQIIPYWLTVAIANGTVIAQGDSTSDIQYYVINGVTAGPGDILLFDGASIHIKG